MRILAATVTLGVSLLTTSVSVASAQSSQPPQAPQPCTSLDGLWLGRTRSSEGVGMWLEFAPDGGVVRAQGRIVDGGYAINGQTLLLNNNVSVSNKGKILPGKLTQEVSFSIAGTEMTRRAKQASVEAVMDAPAPPAGRGGPSAGDGAPPAVPPVADLTETKLTKVKDGGPGDPLSGVWTWTSKSGRPVLERFNGRNRFAMLEPIAGQQGTYTFADNKLSVTAAGATSTVNATCVGMWLTIETPNGQMRFLKFQ